jgi:hypothetical protein
MAATPPAENPRARRTMTTTNPLSPRRSHRPRRRRYLLALALLATISLSACGGGDEDGDQATGAPGASTPAPSPTPSSASGDQDANSSEGTPIRITFGDTVLTARLHDNATARDLAAQLPLTLTFSDLNNVEKIAPLPRELSLEGAPATGHQTAISSSTTARLGSGTASCGSANSRARWTRSSARATTSASRSNARNNESGTLKPYCTNPLS